MKAGRIHAYGTNPVLDEVPSPEPGPHEVLVRVQAASLNPLDVKLQSGNMRDFIPLNFPYTVGTDMAGTVERAGPLAARWRTGDKVVGRLEPTRGGALAGLAVISAAELAGTPPGVSFEEAAAVPTAGGTAWQALFEVAKLKAGQNVLIHAGAGGVGSFAIQLARLAGARVIATASGSGVEIARRLGADLVIDYRVEDFAAKISDADVVLDTVGGETQQRSFGVLRSGGVLVATTSPPDTALAKAHGVTASFVFHQSDSSRLGLILGLLAAGSLNVLVNRRVLLNDIAEAFTYQGSGRARGKIIVSMI